jgi:acyl-CoA reductase-like NAD-dependent aldehyde dehydrogenase
MIPMDAAQAGEGKLAYTIRRPVGIVGAISPFNFPCNLVAHKLAPALAAGCPVVLKPASATPLSALLLAEFEQEAGLPAGWLNVVVGPSSEIGDVLVEDERVKLITFTGSGPVGWGIQERAPRKRVKLELGNSTPVIVAADADVEAAAAKLAPAAFAFAGQTCISVQRIYVARPVYDDFVTRFVPNVEALKVGDPADDDTDIGPVIDEGSRERILAWIEEAKAAGGTLLSGGEEGGLIRPTVLAGVPDTAKASCEEVFGPVVIVNPVDSVDEAIERANGTPFGLQAGVFTASIDTALRCADALDFGGVTVNEAPSFRSDQMPYGGVKASGNTKEGPAYAVREMTEERLVVIQR